jgi:AraC family transcriptional regulator of adaptative response/methylated-DNA-[protein]-cysteine methyltransferase
MNRSEHIIYTVVPSRLGPVLIARSVKGVCAIMIDDDPDVMLADAQTRFPRAVMVRDDAAFADVASNIVRFVENPALPLEARLDIRGTAFQRRVWAALQAIPVGRTASYADIARQLHVPGAARAVGAACAANPLAVAVPCHRVVRSDGDLSGYYWGLERKEALLRAEGAL